MTSIMSGMSTLAFVIGAVVMGSGGVVAGIYVSTWCLQKTLEHLSLYKLFVVFVVNRRRGGK